MCRNCVAAMPTSATGSTKLITAPSFLALARMARSGAAPKAALAAVAGTAVLGVTSITSIVNGHDLGMCKVIAPLTNGA